MDLETGFKTTDNDYYINGEKITYESMMRLGFIRKVYGILTSQLVITILFVLLSMNSQLFSNFQKESSGILLLSFILIIICPIVIVCCGGVMSKVPYNYCILGVFTLAESYLVSFICSISDPKLVFMAAIMTGAMTISLSIYAYTTKTDFTMMGGLYFILSCGFILLLFFSLFTQNKFIHILISVCGVCLYGLYLVYDTQLLFGKHEFRHEIDDYILASFMLYTDIIQIFLYILELLNSLNK